jgi:hypothetical protein
MYTITASNAQVLQGERVEYNRLHDATAKADRLATELGGEFEVIHGPTSAVAYLTSQRAILKRDAGVHFVPWSRLETPKFTAPEIAGFYPAYTRKRIEAVVYRAYDNEAEQPWLVRDGRTGGTRLCANTTESRKLLTAMKNGLTL